MRFEWYQLEIGSGSIDSAVRLVKKRQKKIRIKVAVNVTRGIWRLTVSWRVAVAD
jgi:hypothetical protein